MDRFDEMDEIFGFRGKDDRTLFVITIIQGTDADGVSCGDDTVCSCIDQDAGKFGIEFLEHSTPHLFIQR